MSWRDKVFGPPLRAGQQGGEALGVVTGVPTLGLDALASIGYGPEAALAILAAAGVAGLRYLPLVLGGAVVTLVLLGLSYRQTAAAYPNGGGAYSVTKENLGPRAAVVAAVALLLDYLLNVAVGIAAGIAALVSAVPSLQPHTLALCLLVLLTLTILNLRGVRQSGLALVAPALVYVGSLGVVLVLGYARMIATGGHPQPVVAPPAVAPATGAIGLWLLLGAFANACTAMTGVEAVSNGVPLFREPRVVNARRTLTLIVGTLAVFLLGIGWLCPAYHIGAMAEGAPGYRMVLAQLVAAVAGQGVFYYVSLGSIFIVLTYSAQTSFADFPRVCHFLAEDEFLPFGFARRGRRLVYSLGIVILAVLAAALLVIFGGAWQALIPLFAIGAFSAFVFSQVGMVAHWRRRRNEPGARTKLLFNAIGATATSVALCIIVVAKFAAGAWITILLAPALVWLLWKIQRHYRRLARQARQPVTLPAMGTARPVVIVPIPGWNPAVEEALQFAALLSDDITALHVVTESDRPTHVRELWAKFVEAPARAAGGSPPRLEMLPSPFRRVYQPILDYVARAEREHPDRLIAVIIPELVEPHWYEYLLHNQYGAGLKALLFQKGGPRTVVINTPWRLGSGAGR